MIEQKYCPVVSVIVPMYNAEKYVAECLDSLLNQTFQAFEVIVVDDCSTDNSVAIVESCKEKFNGRLKLGKLKFNSGGGGEPCNKGLIISRGEYIFFMDADDILTQKGLEEMYSFAKDYNADTVYCEKYFMSTGVGQEFTDNIQLAQTRIQNPPFVDKPTLETNDLSERIKKAINYNYWVTPWLRLVSRDLLIDNDIKFDSLIGSNDVNWTFRVLFCSKRFLRVPNPYYVRRMHTDSVSLRRRTISEHVHKWMDRTIRSLKDMDNFMNGIEFFRENLDYRHAVLYTFIKNDFMYIVNECVNLSPPEVYGIFMQNFSKYLGEHDVLTCLLCAAVNDLQKNFLMNQQRFDKYAAQAQQRIAELEKINREYKAYISELEKFIMALNRKD